MLDSTAGQLNSGVTRTLRWLNVVDREAGLTPARLSALSVLVFGGPTTLGRLAALENVAGPTMTRIVDGLEEQGMARRVGHPEDARAVLVEVTPRGERVLRAAAKRRVATLDDALARLSASDRAALDRAGPALLRLVDSLADVVSE